MRKILDATEKNLKALLKLNNLLNSKNIPLFVIIFPITGYDYAHYPEKYRSVHEEMKYFLQKNNIPHRDFQFILRDYDINKIRLDENGHFNEEGNRIVSKHIFLGINRFLNSRLKSYYP